uniref:Uncharacterized protein n=1 Tax=viral metagenome TaxID=1070528 RepID=A0A6M3JBA1_9ZZZZ
MNIGINRFTIEHFFSYINPQKKGYNYTVCGDISGCLDLKGIEEEVFNTKEAIRKTHCKGLIKLLTEEKLYSINKRLRHYKIIDKLIKDKRIPEKSHILIFIDELNNVYCAWLNKKDTNEILNKRQIQRLIEKINRKQKTDNLSNCIYIEGEPGWRLYQKIFKWYYYKIKGTVDGF